MMDVANMLGKLVTDDAATRDAVHVAVAPVTANELLQPGDRVGFVADGVVGRAASTSVGIVDLFLQRDVEKGQHFWLFLYPGTVTSLRHYWTHPAFTRQK